MDEDKRSGESAEDTLIREIRDDFTYFRDYWRENHDEAKIDLRFVSGDPWEPDDRKQREDNGRPVVCPDELDQYLNQAINNLRQNKRAIKVNPAGDGADDQDAERRSAIIKAIEYKSNAQAAYANAFEGAINCGFGYFRLTTKVVGRNGDKDQEPRIKVIENPLSVLPDPNSKEADFSDQKRCFVLDVMRKTDFSQKYPTAQKRSFSGDDQASAPGWFQGENIVVAEYWRIDGYDENGNGGKVKQYITNGLEILEETPWLGSWIPVIPVTGKKVYVPRGGEMKRMFYSMIRKARGPQMMMAYIASQEAEEYGMAPRAPFVGYVGQFNTDKDAWDTLNRVPRSYVQIDPMPDPGTGSILPPPTRPAFIPNAQAYEIGKESWRRSIQAAMGITALPTAAQRQNEKSGVALSRIETQQSIGAYHFTDNFDRSLEYAGRQLDELITKVMDTPRQVSIRQPDETHDLLHVVPHGTQAPSDAAPDQIFDPTKGEFDVTISTGMSYQSQREEASAFVDLLLQELEQLPIPPPAKATLLAKAIKLKDIGPIGDEIAKILDPQGDGEPIPPQAQQMIAQLQQQTQQATQMAQQLGMEKQGKVWESQGKMQQIAAQSQADMALEKLKLENSLAIAEVNTKAQDLQQRAEFIQDLWTQFHGNAHEAALTAQQAAHDQAAAQQQAQAQSQQSAQDAAQQQAAQPQPNGAAPSSQ